MRFFKYFALCFAIAGIGTAWWLVPKHHYRQKSTENAHLSALLQSEIALGHEDAPVTIIGYSSFTCSHCATFHSAVFPQLKQKYIDTGKVRFIFRPYPRDEHDLKACVAVGCVPSHTALGTVTQMMDSQKQWMGKSNFMKEIAVITGIDEKRLAKLVNDEHLQRKILEKRLEAENNYKIDATPAFVINGKVYMGLSELKQFDEIINAAFTGR